MKYRFVALALVVCAILCHTSVIRAQAPEAPVLPMEVKFRYVPQYFEQSFADDPRYARIQALVDQGRCDIILLDKTTNREAFYSTSIVRPAVLAANGADAYTVQIDVTTSSTLDSDPRFVIHFHDQFGQEITWEFIVGEILPHASPEVIFHTDGSGLTLLYAPRRAAGVAGTRVTIAEREYLPASQSDETPAAFYAADMTFGQILPGTDLWNVEGTPADEAQTAKWNLSGDGRRQRVLAVEHSTETEAVVDQTDLEDPDAPRVSLNLVRVNDAYELRSLSLQAHFNTLWIFFGPSLPFPSPQTDDKTIVTFTVAENEQAILASGQLEVLRAVDAEHVLWHFETPSLARGTTLETGVNLVPGPREQASCDDKTCSDLR
jgi:hypothetical protein